MDIYESWPGFYIERRRRVVEMASIMGGVKFGW